MSDDHPKAWKILKDPALFNILISEVSKKVCGEEKSKHTAILIMCGGRLCVNAAPTSTNLMIQDKAGAGKDHLVSSVIELLDPEVVMHRKRITPTVFCYWQKSLPEDFTWDGKVFYGEDLNNQVLHSDVFKVMSSSNGGTCTVVIKQVTVDIVIQGKPVNIITMANARPNAELLRRYPIQNMDTSVEQTRDIMRMQALQNATSSDRTYDRDVKTALGLLQRKSVVVPFADRLPSLFDASHVIMRTHFSRLLDYAKFSALIHQHQRDYDSRGNLIANGVDYEIARTALLNSTSNVFSVPLTSDQQNFIETLAKTEGQWLSISNIEEKVGWWARNTIIKQLEKLRSYGFLEFKTEKIDGSKRPAAMYKCVGTTKLELPTWKQINSSESIAINETNANDESNESNEIVPSNDRLISSISSISSNIALKTPTNLSTQDTQSAVISFIDENGGRVERMDLVHEFGDDYVIYFVRNGILQETGDGGIRLAK